MLISDIHWIRDHRKKLSPKLRHHIYDLYRPLQWYPCFLQPLLVNLKEKLKSVHVIVEHDPDCEQQELVRISSTIQKHKCKIKTHLPIINGFAGEINIHGLIELAASPGVKKIWIDREVKAVLNTSGPVLKAPESWEWGFTGEGITVAVIDSGIYPHPDLIKPSNRLIGFKDFVNDKNDFYDDNGHGTHVAGCIAGNGNCSAEKYKGIAPRANLVGVKVLDRMGSGNLSNVIAGIQWCIDKKEKLGIRVINLSLGSTVTNSYKDDPICKAVEKAWAAGIVVIAAAGNEGPEAGTICSPGIDPVIITVGAIDTKNTIDCADDTIADFSSRGPTIDTLIKPDIVAPGVNIISLKAPRSFLAKQMKQNRVEEDYLMMSGTSMACPQCAGVAAVLLQAFPDLEPDEVKEILTETAAPLPLTRNEQGYGYADLFSSIKSIKKHLT